MCVIIGIQDNNKLPSLEILKKCESANKDGGGVSWVDGGKVHWKKGIEAKEIHEIIKEHGAPCVAHFRIGTVGSKEKGMTHPFPITAKCETSLEGEAERVLFHNGHWNDWRDVCMNMVLYRNSYFPGGDWSDSRAMAWIVNHSNSSFLRFINQKVIIQTAKTCYYFGAFEKKDGVYYSNLNWNYQCSGYSAWDKHSCRNDDNWQYDINKKALKYIGPRKESGVDELKRIEERINSQYCYD